MATVLETTSAYSFDAATKDDAVSLQVHGTVDEKESTLVTATFRHPTDMGVYDARYLLTRAAIGHDPIYTGLPEPEEEIINMATTNGNVDLFASKMRRFQAVPSALGYTATSQTHIEDHQTITETSFTYPSLSTLNTAAERIFPGKSVRFAPFEGGLYSAKEFITRLAETGEVLVATEQPYELHDHAIPHILGWLGFGEDFIGPLREAIGVYVARAAAEDEMPLPKTGQIDPRGRIIEYLNPSLTFLKKLMEKFDLLSADVADELLFAEKTGNALQHPEDNLSSKLRVFWKNGRSAGRDKNFIPDGLLGAPAFSFFDQTARTMWHRYEDASNAVSQL